MNNAAPQAYTQELNLIGLIFRHAYAFTTYFTGIIDTMLSAPHPWW